MYYTHTTDPLLAAVSERAHRIIRELEEFIAGTVIPLEKREGITRDGATDLPVLRQVWKAARERGFFHLMLPPEHGGPGLTTVELCAIKEAVSRTGAALSPHVLGEWNGPPRVGYLLGHVSAYQKQTFLDPVVNGDKGICFALTEESAGSDAAGVKTRAERRGDHYVLSGSKRFISGAPYADYAIVVAVTDPGAGAKGISAFFVDLHAPGAKIFDHYETLLGGHGTADLEFDNVQVPVENLIGAEGEGLKLGLSRITLNRLLHCPSAMGLSLLALDMASERCRTRKQFGAPIGGFQAIQHMLADMASEIYAVRAMMYATAARRDAGGDIRAEACMCKLMTSETAWRVADRALQIHGGEGTVRGHFIEWLYRSSRVFRIANGSSEIQRNTIAKSLLKTKAP
ncbi:acyl-CoA dehydrogenase family protein [Sporosarcina obsidiansis]|uniref:acyl-CoA dehydrogenase family protein n=1 Tax=Sporosarcina obsidiansis TaxID=2660748 RepID=UPI00129A6344|nr:acyl-CoA dehydrogenase family protein [Sporosarcina obsidiansis]